MKLVGIGIDPGSRTGLAVWNGDRVLKALTCDEYQAQDKVLELLGEFPAEKVVFGIEVSRSTRIHPRRLAPGISEDARRRNAIYLKIAQDVGANQKVAKNLLAWVRGRGHAAIELRPRYTKRPKKEIELYVGELPGRTSSHARDAVMLAVRAFERYQLEERIERTNLLERRGGM